MQRMTSVQDRLSIAIILNELNKATFNVLQITPLYCPRQLNIKMLFISQLRAKCCLEHNSSCLIKHCSIIFEIKEQELNN